MTTLLGYDHRSLAPVPVRYGVRRRAFVDGILGVIVTTPADEACIALADDVPEDAVAAAIRHLLEQHARVGQTTRCDCLDGCQAYLCYRPRPADGDARMAEAI